MFWINTTLFLCIHDKKKNWTFKGQCTKAVLFTDWLMLFPMGPVTWKCFKMEKPVNVHFFVWRLVERENNFLMSVSLLHYFLQGKIIIWKKKTHWVIELVNQMENKSIKIFYVHFEHRNAQQCLSDVSVNLGSVLK